MKHRRRRRALPPYVVEDVAQETGQVRLYYRAPKDPAQPTKRSKKIRIWVSVEQEGFWPAYEAAKRGEQLPKPEKDTVARPTVPASKTFRGLCQAYYKSAAFSQLAPGTQKYRRLILDHCCEEPLNDSGDGLLVGGCSVAKFGTKHVKWLVDLKAGLPEAANSRVKSVRAVFAWHQEGDETARNPCAGIKKLKPKRGGGFHAWTVEEVAAYEAVHAIGTQARVAFDLALYTLQGRSDVARFGPEHVTLTDDGPWLVFRRKKSDNPIEIPVIDPLAESIAARPKLDGEAFVLTTEGKPFTANGLGNAFRVWCDEAGLPNCAMHGLRKAQSSKLAELGVGDLGIGAVTGHAPGSRSLSIYTAAARRKLMAKQAMRRLAESLPGSQMSQKTASNVKNWDIQEEKTDAC